jgi:hypothetical protein
MRHIALKHATPLQPGLSPPALGHSEGRDLRRPEFDLIKIYIKAADVDLKSDSTDPLCRHLIKLLFLIAFRLHL